MNNKWTIREATLNDSRAIAQLHSEVNQAVYHTDNATGSIWEGDPPSWWKWWNLDNPPKKHFSYVADDAGRIVGHNANRYTWLNIGGERILGGFGWGVMTHPDYMRQGMYSSLLKTRVAHLTRDGVVLVYTSVSELGRISGLALGTLELGRSNSLVRIINPRSLVMKKTGSSALAAISGAPLDFALRLFPIRKRKRTEHIQGNIVEISFFDERFDHLWAKMKDVLGISVWKDAEYLNWRYVARPDTKYRILAVEEGEIVYGFVVLRCIEDKYRVGHIADWLFLPGKEAHASLLIDGALDCLRESGADIATCHTFWHDPCYHLLRGKGFLHRGQGNTWILNKLAEDLPLNVQDVRNWFLTPGDSDGV